MINGDRPHDSVTVTAPFLKLLLVSTPVGPLGSGLGGGVELTLKNIAQALLQRGHQLQVVAPHGSRLPGVALQEIAGKLQTTAQSQGREALITLPEDAVLANMWDYARQVAPDFDAIINFAYDWLPFYLTPFFTCPVAHLVSMGSLNAAMDRVIARVATQFPGTVGVHSWAQAETFEFASQCRVLANGLDLTQYEFCAEPENVLAWVGRIAPEKGIEDAIAASSRSGIPLHVWGALPDEAYWHQIQAQYPHAEIHYQGFLPTAQLQAGLRRCRGLLMTPRWVEAFGNVAIEALACGVPVIAYQCGGPAEIVQSGKTGWLVEPDEVEGLVTAIAQLDRIDRQTCRQTAEAQYSMTAMGDRVEAWLGDILSKGTFSSTV